jgi:hypothetical protein
MAREDAAEEPANRGVVVDDEDVNRGAHLASVYQFR